MQKSNFKKWFTEKLTIGAFPYLVNKKFDALPYDYIINVSDEWYSDIYHKLKMYDIKQFWFPMNEVTKDIGLNSIYGAMVALNNAEKEDANVYLHCHMGANRSATVQECYYFMRTNKHLRMFFDSLLYWNCEKKHLPELKQMESFLGNIATNIKHIKTGKTINDSNGGILDYCKLESFK